MDASSSFVPLSIGFEAMIMESSISKKAVSTAHLNALPSPYFKGELPAITLTNGMYNKGLSQWKFSLIGRLDFNRIKLEKARVQLFK